MTVTLDQLGLYVLAMAGLWVIPGPVWVALTARALSGGMAGAWPLAVGVALGDLIWPFCAILGLAWVLSLYGDLLGLMRWIAAGVFIVMGILLLVKPAAKPGEDSRLTRPGIWAGFSVGVAAVIGNPKAILFYMGFLPGFFDLSRVTAPDIAAILAVSAIVPMLGNLGLAMFLDRARRILASPERMRRLNIASGLMLVGVGCVIPFT
ncbi:LysE family translocator [Aliigemmobacter aestuarii]|uniref:LysE family translocator n=1 Tax=Aliigemmobacter aestuarii TaxID=1445661 RepID=A0A4S3MVA5_9RHOB|nr:LysE family translocator [Gemmobacter aestuarii]THD85501.1 LysE family translocator [Gemmobacter aestuarii]